MSTFRLTNDAEADLIEIGGYTVERWGDEQCVRYLTRLDERFHALAQRPALGTACDDIRPGYRRWPEGRHVIFYRSVEPDLIEIVRVLYDRMLPENHFDYD